jgi:hypothetical protein
MEYLSEPVSICHQDDFVSEKAMDGATEAGQMGALPSRGMK